MFCPQCGREYSQRVNFCCHCGAAMFTPSAPRRKLMRSRRDKKIAGVCAGFAEYLDLDATLVRLVWLMLVFFAGWGLIGYLVAWIIMPEEPETQPAVAVAPATAPQPASNP
jgi:phage shock protein C